MSSLRLAIKLSLEEEEEGKKLSSVPKEEYLQPLQPPTRGAEQSVPQHQQPIEVAASDPTTAVEASDKRSTSSPTSVTSLPKKKICNETSLFLQKKNNNNHDANKMKVSSINYLTEISAKVQADEREESENFKQPNQPKGSIRYASSFSSIAPPPPTTNQNKGGKMLYVGITLERPEQVKTWGIIFQKEKTNPVQINRIIPPTKEGPKASWCRISEFAPNPALVYRVNNMASQPGITITLDQYERNIVQHFPPSSCFSGTANTDLFLPYLLPGDAIISINGIAVAAFTNAGKFASFIRENCQRKMMLVCLRHELVFNAAKREIAAPPPIKSIQNETVRTQELTTRISVAIKNMWRIVTGGNGGITNQQQVVKRKAPLHSSIANKRPKIAYSNNMFQDENGKPILYCDNDEIDEEEDPDEGKRISDFVNSDVEKSFHLWLQKRKTTWREARPNIHISHNSIIDNEEELEGELTVKHNFWMTCGSYETFDHWLSDSKQTWRKRYSWHKQRRNALQLDYNREVYLGLGNIISLSQFESWLGVRKQQWRLERRKRQRQRGVEMSSFSEQSDMMETGIDNSSQPVKNDTTINTCAITTNEEMYIDDILENEERKSSAKAEVAVTLEPMDITWLFDSTLGCPDDVIVNIMRYLRPSEHGNLLCLSYTTNAKFKLRNDTWRSLCPKHWTLPRRPRKSFCALYISKIRAEEEASRKRSDEILVKGNNIIEKADQLIKFKALITKAEKEKSFKFDVDHTSGIVLERNSLLNLAVIEKRHKITKYLIEEKGADIETYDRGQFSPLMNAAWAGDKQIVRYLLARGCDRAKVGYNHSSQGLAPPSFEGMSAEGWACKRGFLDIAKLIRLGL